MAKRGRKSKQTYWSDEQEQAVKDYLKETSLAKKNRIYEQHLLHPVNKLVESIIHTFKLYSHEMHYEELHADAIGYLHDKFDKFDPDKGKKSFSYYGTVVKHYLMGKRMAEDKHLKRFAKYEDTYLSFSNDEKLSYEHKLPEDKPFMVEYFYEFANVVKGVLDSCEDAPEPFLDKNEIKIGYAIVELMDNWESIFDLDSGGVKYHKNQVLECLRNMTLFNTKDIRKHMKRFQQMYDQLKASKVKKSHN